MNGKNVCRKIDLGEVERVRPNNTKYNLFSAIDEPINSFFSGRECTCPRNSIIAEQISEISWYNEIK
jgi:hypothetical protein